MVQHNRSALLLMGAIVLIAPLLSGCGGARGPIGLASPLPRSTQVLQTTGKPCPKGLKQHMDEVNSPGLVSTVIDPTTFSGTESHPAILSDLPLSCDIRINGEADFSYFYGEHERVQSQVAERLKADGFTRAAFSTPDFALWTHPDGTVVEVLYSKNGGDVTPPGAEAPIPGVGPQEWVCVYFVR